MVKESLNRSEAGRNLVALRRRTEGVCELCGRTFQGIVLRRFCSPACRQKALRQRRNAERQRIKQRAR